MGFVQVFLVIILFGQIFALIHCSPACVWFCTRLYFFFAEQKSDSINNDSVLGVLKIADTYKGRSCLTQLQKKKTQ